MNISICICTFKRPELLNALLGRLNEVKFSLPAGEIEIVVVDNDPMQSANAVLSHWEAAGRIPLKHIQCARPNIALARNAAIAASSGDFLAMIDDDELPELTWLYQLVTTLVSTNSDAVFGPVLPKMAEGTPPWLAMGGFFDRPRYPTGTAIGIGDARTSNVIVRKSCLDGLEGPFCPEFGLTGGEDSLLFRDLQSKGCRFVWCDEAVVEEEVPLQRANARWLLQRSYRIGQTWIRGELARLHGVARWTRSCMLFARSFVQLILAGLFSLCWLPMSRFRAFHWARTCVTQAGKLTALWGIHRLNVYGSRT
jgi:succinoglycan biosynthesis protein ExoM